MGNEAQIQDRVSVNSVRFVRPREDPQGELRDFEAAIEVATETGDESLVIGGISGCLSWSAWLPDLADNSRMVGSFAEIIAAAVEMGDMMPTEPETRIESALIITSFWLEPQWRGNRLSRRIFGELIDLLLLTPESTLVVTYLEPQSNPASTQALSAHHETPHMLQDAFRQAGFERWRQSNAWWMRPESPTGWPEH
jgi:hypothetical protein